jgi:hypothetical protein
MALKDYLDVPEHLEKYKKGLPNGEMHDAIVRCVFDSGAELHLRISTVICVCFLP